MGDSTLAHASEWDRDCTIRSGAKRRPVSAARRGSNGIRPFRRGQADNSRCLSVGLSKPPLRHVLACRRLGYDEFDQLCCDFGNVAGVGDGHPCLPSSLDRRRASNWLTARHQPPPIVPRLRQQVGIATCLGTGCRGDLHLRRCGPVRLSGI
jgi:hypothetical protein